ncbi:hypothetical protein DWW69_09670 [Bacteroides sp. AF16-49]|uniref:hypothetical protein n=1 Tax=Bacteroides sp. AF16-49 TaxID=2292192 RepID=UPI000EFDDEB3|nr:hypothetical protein [Bacteroides sp. AF16-49]RHR75548.1 hypothetical protein DWW69_09670 [Bacteroides sp. AF16-49]
MYLKKEKEFQYHPAIVKMLEDVVGGGIIARTDLRTALFDGQPLDELPPYCIVGKDTNGGWHVIKTAKVAEAVAEAGKIIKVSKNHLFAVGDFVTAGGALTGASDKITAIDKTNTAYDSITLAATIGAIAKDAVLVAVKAKADAGSAVATVDTSEVTITMSKVDLTVANQSCGLMVRGTIEEKNMPFSLDADLKKLMPLIRFV